MKKNKRILWVLAFVLVGVIGLLLYWPAKRRVETVQVGSAPPKGGDVAEQTQTNVSKSMASVGKPPDAVLLNKGSGSTAEAGKNSQPQMQTANEVQQTADQVTAELMQERLDDGNEDGALKLAQKLMKSKEVEVRSDVVTVLGMIGIKALPELSKMIDDEDEDVSQEAFQQWLSVLDELENDDLKQRMLTARMMMLSDVDTLEECVMAFSGMDEVVVINGLLPVIESNNPNAAQVAREHYEHVTGEEYTTAEAAKKLVEQLIKDDQ